MTSSGSPNRIAFVFTGSLAIVALLLDNKLVLPTLLLVNLHSHLTLSASSVALVMMMVQLLVAHAVVTAMAV